MTLPASMEKVRDIESTLNYLLNCQQVKSLTQYGLGRLDAYKEIWLLIQAMMKNARVVEVGRCCELCALTDYTVTFCTAYQKKLSNLSFDQKPSFCTAKRVKILIED